MTDATRAIDNEELDFDVEALRAKYLAERDKRLRSEGEAQYVETTGTYARFANVDPMAPNPEPREAVMGEVDVVIVGGGFSGMLMAARLLELGITDVRIVEAGADFGGTWYWNQYPGAQCDIESYCYLPLLEETGYIPKEKYSYAPEIFEHSQRIGRQYGLYDLALFQTRVVDLSWDELLQRWIVATDRGDAIRARFAITATGPASKPKLPGIPGIERFKGHSFHTGRWDYPYTGGSHSGGLEKLSDKRVAVIGTGATAIQCVPHVGAAAKHLYVFQRTPSSVDFRNNRPTDPQWAASLQPGWQRERRENFNAIVIGQPFEVDFVNDGWTEMFRDLKRAAPIGYAGDASAEAEHQAEIADFRKMNRIRARVDAVVHDSEIAEVLKPWYRQFCKRPTFNDDYLDTFNRPNVTLIDTSTSRGVECITESAVIANGVEYEVDCIIFATGFEIRTAPRRRIDFDIRGVGGQSLFDYWSEGVRTLHGHSTRGFPNWFFVGVGQNGVSVNATSMFDDQARHIAYIVNEVRERGAVSVQPTEAAEASWVAEIRRLGITTNAFIESCTPGYYNNEGQFDRSIGAMAYGPGANAFNALLADWREAGDLEGLELVHPDTSTSS